MEAFWNAAAAGRTAAPPDPASAQAAAAALGLAAQADVYPTSVTAAGGVVFALARRHTEKVLLAAWPAETDPAAAEAFDGTCRNADLPVGRAAVMVCGRTAEAAAALRRTLPWTVPQAVAGRPSIGLGDRLGLATPGHIRAVRGTGYVPMLAQQSIREMTRTRRSPQNVVDDATWGVFQEGFTTGFGADADHLKAPADIDACAAAGFTFYTIDPGDHVDDSADAADSADPAALAEAFEALPWARLETTATDTLRAFAARPAPLSGGRSLEFDEAAVRRAAVKYGKAVAHTSDMYRHLCAVRGKGNFELEVSVDETEAPTTPAEHFYVARELARLGVRWVSLAPRFVGRFEKGVDYIGDLAQLETAIANHLAVAAAAGDYKLSLHSGSDKFSVYPVAARLGGRRVHVKTAGTSYLEALRVAAMHEPGLFRRILGFARSRYEADKATYHVSARLEKVLIPDHLADGQLPASLDQFDTREALHVTYGSVLTAEDGAMFKTPLLAALKMHEEAYAEVLRKHIGRHLAAFL